MLPGARATSPTGGASTFPGPLGLCTQLTSVVCLCQNSPSTCPQKVGWLPQACGKADSRGQLHSGPAASPWRPRAGPGPGEPSVCLSLSWEAGEGARQLWGDRPGVVLWGRQTETSAGLHLGLPALPPAPDLRGEAGQAWRPTRFLQGPGKAGASHRHLLHPRAPEQAGPAPRPLTWWVLKPALASRLPAVEVSPGVWVGRCPPRGFSEAPRPQCRALPALVGRP